MKVSLQVLSFAVCSLSVFAVDLTGTWKAEFDTEIGIQKYTFAIKQDGTNITGIANSDIGGEQRETPLEEGQLNDDVVSFVEKLDFQGTTLRITYTGKIDGDEIEFTREVGDYVTEEFTAKRSVGEAEPAAAADRPRNRREQPPIVLGPDDKPAFPATPEGFDAQREDIAHGEIETVEYDSKTVGNKRKMMIYTPPRYSTEAKYPVLYLLHGIGGDETEWYKGASPQVILDNLCADGKLVPMIVVMPNGRAKPNDRAEGNIFAPENVEAFAKFQQDLLKDVIPFIESNYPVKVGRDNRALAGLSMGGGQSLNFGLGHLDTFTWVGGFSSAPNTKPPEELVPDPEAAAKQLKLLWVSCGDKDGLMHISQGVHAYLKENEVPHIWHVDSGGHDFAVWKNDLYLFSQLLFR